MARLATPSASRRLCTTWAAWVLALFLWAATNAQTARADQLTPTFTSTDGSACTRLADGDFSTTEHFDAGCQITVNADEPLDALYILWEDIPGPWSLEVGEDAYGFGKERYLHEYVELPEEAKGASEATIVIPQGGATIADVYALSAGALPDFVQVWEPSYDKADLLFVSTHADDECLFLGGAIPTYCNRPDVRVQVAYFCDFWQTEPYRNHEILNGLWVMGVTHYPQLGEFVDIYSETLDQAAAIYDYDDSLAYMVRTLRRFEPQVVVGQDIVAGEYGHGAHMWSAQMIADALEPAADASQYEDSAQAYGTWDVPKTYFHLYPEQELELDARVPLDNLGGATALDLAKASFLQHLSQQYTWFYVDDGYDENGNPNGYPYSCTKYGLYRSLVGDDTGTQDLLENIRVYDEQEAAQKAEEASDVTRERSQSPDGDDAGPTESETDTHPDEQDADAHDDVQEGLPLVLRIMGAVVLLALLSPVIVTFAIVRAQRTRHPQKHRK